MGDFLGFMLGLWEYPYCYLCSLGCVLIGMAIYWQRTKTKQHAATETIVVPHMTQDTNKQQTQQKALMPVINAKFATYMIAADFILSSYVAQWSARPQIYYQMNFARVLHYTFSTNIFHKPPQESGTSVMLEDIIYSCIYQRLSIKAIRERCVYLDTILRYPMKIPDCTFPHWVLSSIDGGSSTLLETDGCVECDDDDDDEYEEGVFQNAPLKKTRQAQARYIHKMLQIITNTRPIPSRQSSCTSDIESECSSDESESDSESEESEPKSASDKNDTPTQESKGEITMQ